MAIRKVLNPFPFGPAAAGKRVNPGSVVPWGTRAERSGTDFPGARETARALRRLSERGRVGEMWRENAKTPPG